MGRQKGKCVNAPHGPDVVQRLSMSLIVVALQPSRNITLAVEHAPDFHMSLALNIED